MIPLLKIHPDDNVAVALTPLKQGEQVTSLGITLLSAVSQGHKIALRTIASGENIIKYGMSIGQATADILRGETVHVHNMISHLSGRCEYQYQPAPFALPTEGIAPSVEHAPHQPIKTFKGFQRTDGSVGIRNDLWIVPTVGCVNRLARQLAETIRQELPCGTVQTALALEHPLGCSQVGLDHERTAQTLAALASHPNAGGVLVLSLGCENNTLESFQKRLNLSDERFRFLNVQEVGDEFAIALELLRDLLTQASKQQREDFPLSELTLGLKCGGSDALSGITANPLVGVVSDWLVTQGGSSILTEVPEMFGAEIPLLNRAMNHDVFQRGVQMINNFKSYFLKYGEQIDENPSPGNKTGGISSLEDKSMGCVQKGGFSPVVDVLDYGIPRQVKGLNLLTGPGNDMIACTLLAAAGCQMVLFTTGRGTPMGSVIPTIKISSNSELANRKPHWIDFNAGELLTGTTLPLLAEKLFHQMLEIASGDVYALNERHQYQEIALFKEGLTL